MKKGEIPMDYSSNDLFYDMSVFYDRMASIDMANETEIIGFCSEVESYLYDKGLVCRRYQVYQDDWKRFNDATSRSTADKTLYELLVYLFIYSREEHFCGGYGSCYVAAFRNGAIPELIRGIVIKLEIMAITEADTTDKTGRIGVAGEYFVMAELTRRGYVASLTSKNTKAIDLLVSDKNGRQLAAIQVKTCDNAKQQKWKMGNGVENNDSANLYYVFVNMNGGNEPSYYVVPSRYVAYRVKQDYEEWYNTPGKQGQQRNETTMRTFEFVDKEEQEQYKDAWYLLGM